ncbi:MAG: serine O-acetyltransferase EpsC [Cyanobacteriota bacterium]
MTRSPEPIPVAEVAAALGVIRREALQRSDPPRRAVQLPSGQRLRAIISSLRQALYPNRLGLLDPDSPLSSDEQVEACLVRSLEGLKEQVAIELSGRLGAASAEDNHARVMAEATAITTTFAKALPGIRALLDSDIDAAYHGDPAADSLDEIVACYPGIKAITHHRFAHLLHQQGVPVIARIITEDAHAATGIDIHPGARIGERFFIDHGTGVVIGGTAVIGDGVRIYQAVTLGARSFPIDEQGHLVKGLPRHPIVEDDVVIYSGATILGRVTIGQGSTIGGNVWITESVPPGTTITQARARQETFGEGAGI